MPNDHARRMSGSDCITRDFGGSRLAVHGRDRRVTSQSGVRTYRLGSSAPTTLRVDSAHDAAPGVMDGFIRQAQGPRGIGNDKRKARKTGCVDLLSMRLEYRTRQLRHCVGGHSRPSVRGTYVQRGPHLLRGQGLPTAALDRMNITYPSMGGTGSHVSRSSKHALWPQLRGSRGGLYFPAHRNMAVHGI